MGLELPRSNVCGVLALLEPASRRRPRKQERGVDLLLLVAHPVFVPPLGSLAVAGSNNQYRLQTNADDLEIVFEGRVRIINNVVAMLDGWENPVYLTRIWTIFEQYTATKLNVPVTMKKSYQPLVLHCAPMLMAGDHDHATRPGEKLRR